MKLFGLEISRAAKAAPTGLQSAFAPSSWMGYFGQVLEPWTGAWQCNVTIDPQPTLLSFSAVFCCITGIASDIAKLPIKLNRKNGDIWEEIESGSPSLPVLREPNHYQHRLKFIEQWIVSKLISGNTYILLERDNRGGSDNSVGVVRAMYILDPRRVTVKIADDGSVWYELAMDNLSQVEDRVIVPASQMIHDTMVSLWHPLIGVSPLYACGLAATLGNKILSNSTNLFANKAMPGGMLTAPGRISDDTAKRMSAKFQERFGGENLGKILVGGDGLKFEPFSLVTPQDAQVIEQLKMTVSDVARAFHYPEWKLGGDFPPYSGGPQAVTLAYYTDCLQPLIEQVEISLDKALRLPKDQGVELDTENLLRMDTASLMDSIEKGTRAAVLAPNEGRRKINLPPVAGGDSPYLQQQNYSLEALAKRDAQDDPFAKAAAQSEPKPQEPPQESRQMLKSADVAVMLEEFAEMLA